MEGSPALTYLVVAYSVFFLLLAAYGARIGRRNRELWDAVARLEKRLEETARGGS